MRPLRALGISYQKSPFLLKKTGNVLPNEYVAKIWTEFWSDLMLFRCYIFLTYKIRYKTYSLPLNVCSAHSNTGEWVGLLKGKNKEASLRSISSLYLVYSDSHDLISQVIISIRLELLIQPHINLYRQFDDINDWSLSNFTDSLLHTS